MSNVLYAAMGAFLYLYWTVSCFPPADLRRTSCGWVRWCTPLAHWSVRQPMRMSPLQAPMR